VVIIHTNHIRNALPCTYLNLGSVFLRTNDSTISIYVNLFLLFLFVFTKNSLETLRSTEPIDAPGIYTKGHYMLYMHVLT